jgi:bifunctional lysine-specific demethylase and histidyl-hydroxylase NO66
MVVRTAVPRARRTAARAASQDSTTVALTVVRTAGPTVALMAVPVPRPTQSETLMLPDGHAVLEGEASRPALQRCTTADPQFFAQEIWGRQAFVSQAAHLPRDFADLFSVDAADRLLSQQGLRTPFVRVARDGNTLAAVQFTAGGGAGATIGDQVSDVRLAQLFADGSTIVLQALHRTHGPLIAFAQALGGELGHPVQVNAYLTPPQAQGFSAHYDVHDVFVLQLSGEKRWRVHAPVHASPLRDQPWTDRRAAVQARAAQPPLLDTVLRPGDALYLPRGFLHAATALGQTSAHLTIGVHVWTRHHLVESLLAATEEFEELRAALPLGVDLTDPSSMCAEIAATIRALTRRLPQLDPEQIAAQLVPHALGAAKAGPVSPLAQAAAMTDVQLGDRLQWREALRVGQVIDGDKLVLHTPDGDVRLPLSAAPSVERLMKGEALTVADLTVPGVGARADQARRDLARVLLHSCLTVRA